MGTDTTPATTTDTDTDSQMSETEARPKRQTGRKDKLGVEEKENVVRKSPTKMVGGGNSTTTWAKDGRTIGNEDKEARTPDEDRLKKLEKRKNKLRWLKIEQRLVELDIAVKSSLHLERPSPDRCITALEALNEMTLAPFMRLRKYIGPHSFNTWPDKEARKKMEKSIETIQKKADQIYNKFKSYFAYQGEKSFAQMFEEEVEEFRLVTQGMEESKVLSMTRDPTREAGLSDED